MFAFVLYLTGNEGWNPDWGGALQLFSTNEAGEPKEHVKDIIPANNQFIFFPVTNKSFHQVNSFALAISKFYFVNILGGRSVKQRLL